MRNDVRVSIERKKPVTGKGEMIPLLFAGGRETEVPYTECYGVDEVSALFGKESAVTKAAGLMWMQSMPPKKIAVLGAAKKACEAVPLVAEKPWRQLLVCSEGEEDTLENVAKMVQQAEGKILFAEVNTIQQAVGLTMYERLFLLFDPEKTGLVAAVLGASAGRMAGSFTYRVR